MAEEMDEPEDFADPEEIRGIYELMTARSMGQLHALETVVTLLLARVPDLEDMAREADKILLQREAQFVEVAGDENADFTIKTHEMARQNVAAFFANARDMQRRKR